MVAQITTLQLRPDSIEEAVHIFEREIIPLVQRQIGCRYVTLLTQSAGAELISISWWESEAALLAGQLKSSYQQQVEQLMPLLRCTPVNASYQVSLQFAPI
jgi:heme-degrading monooxygenase HmoA